MNAIKTYTIVNSNKMSVEFLNIGGAITAINVPVGHELRNIVIAYNSVDKYLDNRYYLGAAVGPIAGRVKNGKLNIKDAAYSLAINTDRGHHLHGGEHGFSSAFWDVQMISPCRAVLKYNYVAGTDGYNANIDIAMTYALEEDNSFTITYAYQSDRDTYINPTNHTYFNLAGSGDVLNHKLSMDAKALALGDDFMPTGEYILSDDFDFSKGRLIKNSLSNHHEQLVLAGGIDHPFIFEKNRELICAVDDLKMTIKTTTPAVVIYTSNFLSDNDLGFINHQGICFETQEAPNAMAIGQSYKLTLNKCAQKSVTTYAFESSLI